MKATLIALTLAAGGAGLYTAMDCGTCCSEALVYTFGGESSAEPATDGGGAPAVTAQIVGRDGLMAEPAAIRADFVEARSASVFAGACHVQSEVSSQGRQALMAWSIDEGRLLGVDLAGTRVVAAVSGSGNLADECARTCVVWIDAPDGREQREAAQAWFVAAHTDAAGQPRAIYEGAIDFERCGDRFSVAVGDVVSLAGEAIADGSCCSMQEHRWYEPLGATAGLPVGVPDECRFGGYDGLPAWRYEGENNTFVGQYEAAAPRLDQTADAAGTYRGPSHCVPPSRSTCTPKRSAVVAITRNSVDS